MDPRETLKNRYEASAVKSAEVKLPVFDSVPLEYINESGAGRLRQCIHYIQNHTGISYNGIGKKGKIVYKFMRFIVDPIVAQQNGLDGNITVALTEFYKLNKQRTKLHNRVNELEAKLAALESKL